MLNQLKAFEKKTGEKFFIILFSGFTYISRIFVCAAYGNAYPIQVYHLQYTSIARLTKSAVPFPHDLSIFSVISPPPAYILPSDASIVSVQV